MLSQGCAKGAVGIQSRVSTSVQDGGKGFWEVVALKLSFEGEIQVTEMKKMGEGHPKQRELHVFRQGV